MAAKTQAKPGRTMRHADGVLKITDGGKTDTYDLEPIREDGCLIGCRFAKRGGDAYDVDGRDGTCHCWGHLRHGKCRHVAAFATLRDLGRI